MKATLIKEKEGVYSLLDSNRFISTTECKEGTLNKLSLKNCEAIANGYDLDELVEDIVKTIVPNDRGDDIWYGTSMAVGKLCFQKALEILGDKKFSEDDVLNAIEMYYGKDKIFIEIIHSLQQTEWDVEIEQELIQSSIQGEAIWETKLDADGCLILKRI